MLTIDPLIPIVPPQDGGAVFLIRMDPLYLGDLVALGYVAAILAVSAFTYKFIEEPGRCYFNRLAILMRERMGHADEARASSTGN